MICPYRKVTKTFTATDGSRVTTEEYATCYGKECPWYYENGYELCDKVESEK